MARCPRNKRKGEDRTDGQWVLGPRKRERNRVAQRITGDANAVTAVKFE